MTVELLAIQQTLSRFANSFDLHDWALMESILASTLVIDYSDLRDEPPKEVSAQAYVQNRQQNLSDLNMHHLMNNFDITITDYTAIAIASCLIYRHKDGHNFNSHAIYRFKLAKDEIWRITHIKQTILWNEGESLIHSGAKL